MVDKTTPISPLVNYNKPAVPISHEKATVGMRVQDHWGRVGTLRWVGKLVKADSPPNGETGRAFGVEYDDESANPLRSDGEWGSKRYFTCDKAKGMLCKPTDLFPEMNTHAVEQLRERFGDRVAQWHDFELVKFCIARRFELPKVIEMLDKHLQWRESFQPSHDEYFPQEFPEDYPCGYTGTTDVDENLIYCERPGNAGHCHPSEFVRKYTLPVIARWHACGVEMGMQRMRASGYHHKRVCYIVDLLKVDAMTRPMIGFAQTLATVEQDNYPENLGRVFIVNCPAFFRFAWKLVKIFIDDRTNKKINFCAPNKAIEPLKAVMREEDIPTFCGGTSELWMETNGGRLGSSDPGKLYTGVASPNTQAVMTRLEDAVLSDDGVPLEGFSDEEAPTTSTSNSSGSPSASQRTGTSHGSPNMHASPPLGPAPVKQK